MRRNGHIFAELLQAGGQSQLEEQAVADVIQ